MKIDENPNNQKKNKDRSAAYPVLALNTAIELAQELLNKLGKGPYSRDEAVKAWGHSSLTGPAARKVAALVHYGLLERSGNTYTLGELSQDILFPISDEKKQLAIIKAVQIPKLFANLINKYQGQSLPAMLSSVLVREQISHSVAEDVANTFKDSLKFAGLLINGVVIAPTKSLSEAVTEKTFSDNKNEEIFNNSFEFGPIKKPEFPQQYSFSDSGDGWNLTIKSSKPFTSEIRKKLLDLADLLN